MHLYYVYAKSMPDKASGERKARLRRFITIADSPDNAINNVKSDGGDYMRKYYADAHWWAEVEISGVISLGMTYYKD